MFLRRVLVRHKHKSETGNQTRLKIAVHHFNLYGTENYPLEALHPRNNSISLLNNEQ